MRASVTGLNEAILHMRTMTNSLKVAPDRVLQDAMAGGADMLRMVTPERTGQTRASITVVHLGTAYVLVAREPEISYLLEGTPRNAPGSRIYPTSARALRFVVDGRVVYARSVQGSRPNAEMNSVVDHIVRSSSVVAQQIGALVLAGRGGA